MNNLWLANLTAFVISSIIFRGICSNRDSDQNSLLFLEGAAERFANEFVCRKLNTLQPDVPTIEKNVGKSEAGLSFLLELLSYY